MTQLKFICTAACTVLFIMAGRNAIAGPSFSYAFTAPAGVVATTDTITLAASFVNNGTEILAFTADGRGFTSGWPSDALFGANITHGTFDPAYDFFFGPTHDATAQSFFNQFAGMALLPGQSLNFVFGNYVPHSGSVSPGSYSIYRGDAGIFPLVFHDVYNAFLEVYSPASGQTLFAAPSDSGFSRDVVAVSVPEPKTYAMLFAGLGILGLITRRRKRINSEQHPHRTCFGEFSVSGGYVYFGSSAEVGTLPDRSSRDY